MQFHMFYLKRLVYGFHEKSTPLCNLFVWTLQILHCTWNKSSQRRIIVYFGEMIWGGLNFATFGTNFAYSAALQFSSCLMMCKLCDADFTHLERVKLFCGSKKQKKQCDGDAQWLFYLKKVHLYDFARNICYFFLF